jgi:hypothetical protein
MSSLELILFPYPWREEPVRTLGFTQHGDNTIYLARDSVSWQKALIELSEDEYMRLVAGTISHEFLHLVLDTIPGRASDKLDKICTMQGLNEDAPHGLYGLGSLFNGV